MKSLPFLFLLLLLIKTAFSQESNNSIGFRIEAYRDTIKDERDAWIKFKLINESDSVITIANYPGISFLAIYSVECGTDTLDTREVMKNMTVCITPYVLQKLEPGESKDLEFNLIGWIPDPTNVKVKFFFSLNALNKDFQDAETDWIVQHFERVSDNNYSKPIF